jgi:serine/threonine-protein kinase RsbW
MEIKLTLALPRDQLSVPVVRRILKQSLETLGIVPDTISDIEVALTEACTNVLDHADGADAYEVSAGIDGEQCVVEVLDRGGGFDASMERIAGDHAEDGRGIALMRALMDKMEFSNKSASGTVVHLEKQLVWKDDAVISRLGRTEGGTWSQPEQLEQAPHPG